MRHGILGDFEIIYFIQAEGVGHIKIGFVNGDDAATRMADLQVGSPVPLRLLGTIPGTMEDEKDLHRRFASSRVVGEWFKPSAELLALINPKETKACGAFEIVEKSVQIKVLTVGRKQFTKSMLDQLPHGKLIDDEAAWMHIGEQNGHLEETDLLNLEDGDFWGWMGGRDLVEEYNGFPRRCGSCWIIFSKDGFIFKWRISRLDQIGPDENDRKFERLVEEFWRRYRELRMTKATKLFIGV